MRESPIEATTIDLGTVRDPQSRTYTGQPRGKAARSKLQIDSFDAREGTFSVRIPDDTYSVSPSFILGLFTQSIRRLGRTGFLARYDFESWPVELREAIEEAIDRVLTDADALSDIA